MKLSRLLLVLLLAACAACALGQESSKSPSAQLSSQEKPSLGKRIFQLNEPIKTIALCTPLNVLVKTGDKRSVFVDTGKDSVPIDAQISPRKELVISTKGSFETSAVPIKIIVTVPAGELKGVSISPTGGALVVEGPVEPQTGVFNISSVMGAADLIAQNVLADSVYVASSGTSRVFLLNSDFPKAKVKTAHLAAGGTSSTFVFGADNLDVMLEGAADVAVDPRPGGNVTGVSLGANSVFAVAANTTRCLVGGPFGDACIAVRGTLANRLTPPVFSCGIAAVGPFSCPVSAAQVEGSAERMGVQAPSPSLAEGEGGGAGAAPSPSQPAEIATGGKRRRRLSQQQQQQQQQQSRQQQTKGSAASASTPQVPVLVFNSSVASMRHCDAKFEDLKMAGAKVEESA